LTCASVLPAAAAAFMQIAALPQLLQWLSAQNSDSSNQLLHNRLDMSRVAVAGHSRGGKLAALQYAQGKGIAVVLYICFVCFAVLVSTRLECCVMSYF
jgi:predicted dienelactone hydrolase